MRIENQSKISKKSVNSTVFSILEWKIVPTNQKLWSTRPENGSFRPQVGLNYPNPGQYFNFTPKNILNNQFKSNLTIFNQKMTMKDHK